MVNDFFDKTYCINLDKRTDRWVDVNKQFDKHNLEVERFSAISGNPDNIQTKIVPGHVGCVLSHYNVIKKAKELNLNNVLIFEDDVVFDDDLQNKFNIFIKQLPNDWDILYFGGNHNGNTLKKISENISKVSKTYTTHAYAIKNTVYDAVIKMFPQMKYEVDVMYSILQNSFNCYVFRPHLAWQNNGYSDILKKNVNYDFLKN